MKWILLAAIGLAPLASASEPILATGHWVQNDGRYQTTWPGGMLSAQFTGTSVGVVLNDERSFYVVEIDGKPVQQISPASGKRTVWLKNLPAGNHRIDLIRRNETPDYVGQVHGFVLEGGQWQAAPETPKRKIEFIGDSFTAALANLSTQRECSDREISASTDASQGFAIKTARELGAQWQVNAMSGMGMVRNWGGNLPDRNFRTFYSRQLQTDATSKLDDKWQPQVVVIGLGTNDFSTRPNASEKRTAEQLEQDYLAAYQQLIKELNTRYQQPQIILTALKLWPDDQLRPLVKKIVADANSAGNTRVHYLELSPMQLSACQWHPNLSDHQQVTAQVLDKIKEIKPSW